MLISLAQIVPAAALIPVHGTVQLGSNANRAIMTRRYIMWPMVGALLSGALIGAVIASFIVVQIPLELLQVSVALYVLIVVWRPQFSKSSSHGSAVFTGVWTTIASMFVGASGPMVASYVYPRITDTRAKLATFSATLAGQHILKGFVFSLVGFEFLRWAPLILIMIIGGAIGTYLGLKIAQRLQSVWFDRLFRWGVSILALKLLGASILGSL